MKEGRGCLICICVLLLPNPGYASSHASPACPGTPVCWG